MIKEQVEIEILSIDGNTLLAFNESKSDAQFENEGFHLAQDGRFQILLSITVFQPEEIKDVGIAKNQIGCELIFFSQRFQLLAEQFVRLLRQRGAFKKHRADFLL